MSLEGVVASCLGNAALHTHLLLVRKQYECEGLELGEQYSISDTRWAEMRDIQTPECKTANPDHTVNQSWLRGWGASTSFRLGVQVSRGDSCEF
mmetsp:Transcript_54327/g.140311  ORF Transcript_54327/g.140311 Transcript_54327/m.140311 type:complete len:94 (-) Transcript_54327:217-498(-)